MQFDQYRLLQRSGWAASARARLGHIVGWGSHDSDSMRFSRIVGFG
jgi:beta-lactamase class D